jgi:hypothetical protein
MPQINLRVTEETKTEWENYVDNNSEVNSVSALIRLSVKNEIEGRESEPSVVESDGVSGERIEEIEQQYNTLRNGFEDLSNQMNLIAGQLKEQPSSSNSKAEIYSAIPKGKQNAITFEELAGKLSEPFFTPTYISALLENLLQNSNQTHMTEGDVENGIPEDAKFYRE